MRVCAGGGEGGSRRHLNNSTQLTVDVIISGEIKYETPQLDNLGLMLTADPRYILSGFQK